MAIRFLTGGESHGRGLVTIVEGLPAGLELPRDLLESELARRRRGWGRGPRMAIERDRLEVWSGLRDGVTTGAPLSICLENTEWESWRGALDPHKVDPEKAEDRRIDCPRPGHSDMVGGIKYGHSDMRNVLERSSARSTAALTLAGTVARALLDRLGVTVRGAVTSIGGVAIEDPLSEEEWTRAETSDLGCPREVDEKVLISRISKAKEEGDSLGGTFLVSLWGMPVGVGSYVEWDRRLDGRLAGAVMSIPAIKGVEIGGGFNLAALPGSLVHDEIAVEDGEIIRLSNRAGGLEGGMTNGQDVLIRAAMKPIPTMRKPLRSVDLARGENTMAHFERSDSCAVSAACVVGEAMVAWVAASALTERFGGDVMEDLERRVSELRLETGRDRRG
jgi:chorismate synthase